MGKAKATNAAARFARRAGASLGAGFTPGQTGSRGMSAMQRDILLRQQDRAQMGSRAEMLRRRSDFVAPSAMMPAPGSNQGLIM